MVHPICKIALPTWAGVKKAELERPGNSMMLRYLMKEFLEGASYWATECKL